MTIKKIAELLKRQGHKVTLYKRPDGGYRVTKIDGIKFDVGGNAGNDFARNLAGRDITRAQVEQRRKAQPLALAGKTETKYPTRTTKKGKIVKMRYRPRPQSLTIRKGDTAREIDIKKRIRKMRAKLKNQGVITNAKTLRQRIKREGLENTVTTLSNISRNRAGIAYPRAVESLQDYISVILNDKHRDIEGVTYFVESVNALLESKKKALADELLSAHPPIGLYALIYEIEKVLDSGMPFDADPYVRQAFNYISQANALAYARAEAWGIDLNIE